MVLIQQNIVLWSGTSLKGPSVTSEIDYTYSKLKSLIKQ